MLKKLVQLNSRPCLYKLANMLNSPVLETIISLVIVVLIFSVLVSCIQEGYVTLKKSRGKMLQVSINDILNDAFNKNFAYLFYQHPQVDLLKRKQGELPSYIDGETFANTLVDLIAKESTETVYKETDDNKVLLKKERFKQSLMNRPVIMVRKEDTSSETSNSEGIIDNETNPFSSGGVQVPKNRCGFLTLSLSEAAL